jgi:hypothetical protein
MLLPEEFAQLLDELNRNELPYVVVGGVAVNLLGRERLTRDVDVLVPSTRARRFPTSFTECLSNVPAWVTWLP